MRFASFIRNGRRGLAVGAGGAEFVGRYSDERDYPGDLHSLIESGPAGLVAGYERLLSGRPIDMSSVVRLPPIPNPEKIICVELNYLDHTSESGFVQPDYPTLFTRVNSSLVGDGAPIIRPNVSEQLDYEGELVAVIGRGGRHIKKADALDHVAGYSMLRLRSKLSARRSRWRPAICSSPARPRASGSLASRHFG